MGCTLKVNYNYQHPEHLPPPSFHFHLFCRGPSALLWYHLLILLWLNPRCVFNIFPTPWPYRSAGALWVRGSQYHILPFYVWVVDLTQETSPSYADWEQDTDVISSLGWTYQILIPSSVSLQKYYVHFHSYNPKPSYLLPQFHNQLISSYIRLSPSSLWPKGTFS